MRALPHPKNSERPIFYHRTQAHHQKVFHLDTRRAPRSPLHLLLLALNLSGRDRKSLQNLGQIFGDFFGSLEPLVADGEHDCQAGGSYKGLLYEAGGSSMRTYKKGGSVTGPYGCLRNFSLPYPILSAFRKSHSLRGWGSLTRLPGITK